jgi:hypothetical protein
MNDNKKLENQLYNAIAQLNSQEKLIAKTF